jgi:hypothetical protein
MRRKPITARIVKQIDHLLAQSVEPGVIAAHLKVTEYLVRTIANDAERQNCITVPQHKVRPQRKPYRGVEAAEIRMIQRLLQVGMLKPSEIAREVGVSRDVVEQVAIGRRIFASTERPLIFRDLGEQFSVVPKRCGECGARISISPCRTCRALRKKIIFSNN